MFFDWLDIEQDFGFDLPTIGTHGAIRFELDTGEATSVRCFPQVIEGSYSTKVTVTVSGSLLRVRGNPSRFGRQENLFGLTTLDACVSIFNKITKTLGLPPFTKCTKIENVWDDNTRKFRQVTDGAVIKEIHCTTNVAVGEGNVDAYLKGLATQSLNQSRGCLYPNGKTVDWKSEKGNASLVYCNAYNKQHELTTNALAKAKRNGMPTEYLEKVVEYCRLNGIVRYESKIKSRKLKRDSLHFYGKTEEIQLKNIHQKLVEVDRNLKVERLEMETVSEQLLREGIVDNQRAASTTAMYFLLWLNGQKMDLKKSQVKIHRARLRKLGVDIGLPCDIAKFSPVTVKHVQEINVSEANAPSWYQLPLAA